MSIKLHLCQVLSYYANNEQSVEVSGNNVSECLHNLATQFPALQKLVETPDPARIIHIYINNETNPIEDLTKPVKDGDAIKLEFFLEG